MDDDDRSDPEPPGALLQVTTTLAGLAFALVALVERGETDRADGLAAIALAFSGIAALVASVYGLQELWRRAGLDWRDAFLAGRRSGRYPGAAVAWAMWALILLGLAYAIIGYAAIVG